MNIIHSKSLLGMITTIPAKTNCKTSSFTSQCSLHVMLMEAVLFHITHIEAPN